jgi:hypothetical protein
MAARRLFKLVFVAMALGACGSHGTNHGADGGHGDGSFSTCAMETRATPYTAGMTAMSTSGAYTITLVSVVTTPLEGPAVPMPAVGPATWQLTLADSTGAAPTGVTLTAVPAMPDHSHPPPTLNVPANGQGGYTLELNLFMGGYWTVTFTIQPASGSSETAVFHLCVQA